MTGWTGEAASTLISNLHKLQGVPPSSTLTTICKKDGAQKTTATDRGEHEKHLYAKLARGYNTLARPVRNASEPVLVVLGLDFQQILTLDEKHQVLHSNVWLRMSWRDQYLTWDPAKYANIREVRLPITNIWKPDVLLYNSVDEHFDSTWPINAVVTYCRIDIAYFPFDFQQCSMKFTSWTYSGLFIDLRNDSVIVGTYKPNGEWEILDFTSKRSIFYYDCCPEPYYDITFTITLKRQTLYYGINLVVPSMLISALALFGFTLPPDSGEKLNLCVTIFMSLCVFMLMVAEAIPQTSDDLPLIEAYFCCIMFEVGASVVCTVFALNFHHRTPESHRRMAPLTRKILLEWLPLLVFMKRPAPFDADQLDGDFVPEHCKAKSTPDVETLDFENLFVGEIIKSLDRNTDPLIEKLVIALRNKMPKDAETEKRERSIVLALIPETRTDRTLRERKKQSEERCTCARTDKCGLFAIRNLSYG
ncbi:unnamed protein product [Cylicocyclus nassatus]|uniref:Cation transporter family protein n=1 Tax=Cylicocyclus nassatus TaxID=53992 RepID=A0AA36GL94_CYLNA|nr:unnamed protein product [Cylicocyclus nassatus]